MQQSLNYSLFSRIHRIFCVLLVCKENLQCGESRLSAVEELQLVEQWKFVIRTCSDINYHSTVFHMKWNFEYVVWSLIVNCSCQPMLCYNDNAQSHTIHQVARMGDNHVSLSYVIILRTGSDAFQFPGGME